MAWLSFIAATWAVDPALADVPEVLGRYDPVLGATVIVTGRPPDLTAGDRLCVVAQHPYHDLAEPVAHALGGRAPTGTAEGCEVSVRVARGLRSEVALTLSDRSWVVEAETFAYEVTFDRDAPPALDLALALVRAVRTAPAEGPLPPLPEPIDVGQPRWDERSCRESDDDDCRAMWRTTIGPSHATVTAQKRALVLHDEHRGERTLVFDRHRIKDVHAAGFGFVVDLSRKRRLLLDRDGRPLIEADRKTALWTLRDRRFAECRDGVLRTYLPAVVPDDDPRRPEWSLPLELFAGPSYQVDDCAEVEGTHWEVSAD